MMRTDPATGNIVSVEEAAFRRLDGPGRLVRKDGFEDLGVVLGVPKERKRMDAQGSR